MTTLKNIYIQPPRKINLCREISSIHLIINKNTGEKDLVNLADKTMHEAINHGCD